MLPATTSATGWLDDLDRELHCYDPLGTRTLPNGTQWLERQPHQAPAACLHIVHGPALPEEIEGVQKGLASPIPPILVELICGMPVSPCSMRVLPFTAS